MMARAKTALAPDDPRHGTLTGYAYHGCRCEPCRAANRQRATADRTQNPESYRATRRRYREKKAVREGRVLGQRRPSRSGINGTYHGTLGGYTNHKCRCDDCCQVLKEYNARKRQKRLSAPAPDHVHGTYNGYANYACRCEACRAAYRQWWRKRQPEPKPIRIPKRVWSVTKGGHLPRVLYRHLAREIAALPRFTRDPA